MTTATTTQLAGEEAAKLSIEELEVAFDELTVHFTRTVGHLEHSIRLAAQQGGQIGQALRWLREIREAAGATRPGISHQELCLIIRDLRQRAMAFEIKAVTHDAKGAEEHY